MLFLLLRLLTSFGMVSCLRPDCPECACLTSDTCCARSEWTYFKEEWQKTGYMGWPLVSKCEGYKSNRWGKRLSNTYSCHRIDQYQKLIPSFVKLEHFDLECPEDYAWLVVPDVFNNATDIISSKIYCIGKGMSTAEPVLKGLSDCLDFPPLKKSDRGALTWTSSQSQHVPHPKLDRFVSAPWLNLSRRPTGLVVQKSHRAMALEYLPSDSSIDDRFQACTQAADTAMTLHVAVVDSILSSDTVHKLTGGISPSNP